MQKHQQKPQNKPIKNILMCTVYRPGQNAASSLPQKGGQMEHTYAKNGVIRRNFPCLSIILLLIALAAAILSISIVTMTQEKGESDVQTSFLSIDRNAAAPFARGGKEGSVTICIDPGHGFDDPGALCDYTDKYEKDINLDIALLLAQKLRECGYDIIMTRDSDTPPDWLEINDDGLYLMNPNKRTAFVNESEADIFISIHCNAVENAPDITGTKLYYYGPSNPLTLKYATVLRDALLSAMPGRETKTVGTSLEDSLAVNRDVSIPGVLVECGYMTSPEDCALLCNPEWLDAFACALAEGIDQFAQNKK